MQAPMIHRNGTSREALLDQVCEAARAVWEATLALERASPNQRDYYTFQGAAEAWQRARDEHGSRMRRLTSVVEELRNLADAIANDDTDPPHTLT